MSEFQSFFDMSHFVVKRGINFWMTRVTNEIYDPVSGKLIGSMRTVRTWKQFWQGYFFGFRHSSRTVELLAIRDNQEDAVLLRLKRGAVFLHQEVQVETRHGKPIGTLKTLNDFSRTEFAIYDCDGTFVAKLNGNWRQRQFQYLNEDGRQIGTLCDDWDGLKNEVFSGASFYSIRFDESQVDDQQTRALLLAGCIGYWFFFKIYS